MKKLDSGDCLSVFYLCLSDQQNKPMNETRNRNVAWLAKTDPLGVAEEGNAGDDDKGWEEKEEEPIEG